MIRRMRFAECVWCHVIISVPLIRWIIAAFAVDTKNERNPNSDPGQKFKLLVCVTRTYFIRHETIVHQTCSACLCYYLHQRGVADTRMWNGTTRNTKKLNMKLIYSRSSHGVFVICRKMWKLTGNEKQQWWGIHGRVFKSRILWFMLCDGIIHNI